MIIKINQNKLDHTNKKERDILKNVCMSLNEITTKSDGGVLEIFPEKTESQNCDFKKLYRLLVNEEYKTEMLRWDWDGNDEEVKDGTYISGLKRHYVS